ncbi:hypothetical protein RJT34_12585 [Clitoria ternatea]|uniref:RING-type domain-containing protein n=1 Tax=Clitoria ternatea TaxID=43366 RepID=A0AAN9PKW1_CLITE
MVTEHHHYNFIQWHFNELKDSSFHYSYNQGLFLLLWCVAILIFLPSLFLCFHFCRRRFWSQQHITTTTTTTVISPLAEYQWDRIDFTNNSMMPSSTTKGLGMAEKKECCICLSLFKDYEKLKVLTKCQHAYHSECLDMWLSAHPSCPLCRASVCDSMKKSVI